MAYEKQIWEDGNGMLINAERLNHMEDGVEQATNMAQEALDNAGGSGGDELSVFIMMTTITDDVKGNQTICGRGIFLKDGKMEGLVTQEALAPYFNIESSLKLFPKIEVWSCSDGSGDAIYNGNPFYGFVTAVSEGGGYNLGGVNSMDFTCISPEGKPMTFHLESEAVNSDGDTIFCAPSY